VSPDGKRLTFIALAAGVPNVFVIGTDGRDRRHVTARKTACGRVTRSPDGRHLSFVSFEGKYPQPFVVSADGGEPTQLTRVDGGLDFAHWLSE
jgi:TolB protein